MLKGIMRPARSAILERMSALGHKRTYAVQNGMSALPPVADICSAQANVRFVPKADIPPSRRGCLSLRAALGDFKHWRKFYGTAGQQLR